MPGEPQTGACVIVRSASGPTPPALASVLAARGIDLAEPPGRFGVLARACLESGRAEAALRERPQRGVVVLFVEPRADPHAPALARALARYAPRVGLWKYEPGAPVTLQAVVPEEVDRWAAPVPAAGVTGEAKPSVEPKVVVRPGGGLAGTLKSGFPRLSEPMPGVSLAEPSSGSPGPDGGPPVTGPTPPAAGSPGRPVASEREPRAQGGPKLNLVGVVPAGDDQAKSLERRDLESATRSGDDPGLQPAPGGTDSSAGHLLSDEELAMLLGDDPVGPEGPDGPAHAGGGGFR